MDQMDRDKMMDYFLRWRGVDDPCPRCKGAGVHIYGSGSTWRGGMGTASMAWDVCDVCWGTGDEHRHGVDLRAQRDGENQRVHERAAELLSWSVGSHLNITQPAINAIADELERLSRGRKERPRFFYDLCASLVSMLRKMGASPKT